MPPVEYKKAQSGRQDGFNYIYNPENQVNNMGLLIYAIGRTSNDIYRHNRWDIEVEAIPGATDAKLYVKPTRDLVVGGFKQGQMQILSRDEDSSEETSATYSFADFQSAANNAIQIADLSGMTKARKFKIVVLQTFSDGE
jgi:hypothetical protein